MLCYAAQAWVSFGFQCSYISLILTEMVKNCSEFEWTTWVYDMAWLGFDVLCACSCRKLSSQLNFINRSNPTGYLRHRQVFHSKIVRSAHTVFRCSVFISEQTATFALCNINWLVFITEMKSVYCAVRTGSLNTIFYASSLKGWTELWRAVIIGSFFKLVVMFFTPKAHVMQWGMLSCVDFFSDY
jgi:hypothetical protein